MMCEHPFVRERPYPGWNSKDMTERLNATPLPCGRCKPCRVNKRRMWTLRLLLEASCYGDSLFSTFTYNDESYPKDGNLDPKEGKNLIQRIRRRLKHEYRYFLVGEYGSDSWRAHLHCMLFGVSEQEKHKVDSAWNTKSIERGFTYHLPVNEQTCSYICGYTIKKLTKEGDPQLYGRTPEYMRSSRKNGGIGLPGLKKIAAALVNNPHWEPQIINELRFGQKSYPLGSYLTGKLAELTGVTEQEKQDHLFKYQEGIFTKHFDLGKENAYLLNIVDEHAQDRLKQAKRMKIFNNKRRI